MQHRGEELAIFSHFDALGRGADDVDSVFLQTEREVEWCLAAELGDGAPALFPLINMEHVLQGKRLEVKVVARVVIGGNSFGVRIDHEGLETIFFERERGVNTAIIKLNALSDAVRSSAQDHYLPLIRIMAHFIIAAIVGR